MILKAEFIENEQTFGASFAETETELDTNFGVVNNVGKDGKSAYEIAVDNGFEGDEIEWLNSLRGKDGYSPIRGIDYWTENDKSEIKSYVDEAILGGAW